MTALCPGMAGAAFCLGGFTFSQILSSSSCCWRLHFASLTSWPESCSTMRVRAASYEALASTALVRLKVAWEVFVTSSFTPLRGATSAKRAFLAFSCRLPCLPCS